MEVGWGKLEARGSTATAATAIVAALAFTAFAATPAAGATALAGGPTAARHLSRVGPVS